MVPDACQLLNALGKGLFLPGFDGDEKAKRTYRPFN